MAVTERRSEGLLRSTADSGTSGVVRQVLLGHRRPLPLAAPTRREKLVVSTDADVVPPLPSDAAAHPGETVVAPEAVVDFGIAAADLCGSESAATEQAERTTHRGT